MIIEALKAFLIGIVEGITEWLPISSTGHMILVDEFVKLQVSDEFLALFLVVIQLGAIMAVLILYFHKLNPFSPKKDAVEKKSTWRLWGMVAIGCIPAAVIGLLFDDLVNEYFYNKVTVAAMLGQIGLPGGGFGVGYGSVNMMGSTVPKFSGATLSQGRNAVRDFIPVARLSDMLLSPGQPFQYNGVTYQYPDIRLVYWAGGNPFHHHQDLNRLELAWQRPDRPR